MMKNSILAAAVLVLVVGSVSSFVPQSSSSHQNRRVSWVGNVRVVHQHQSMWGSYVATTTSTSALASTETSNDTGRRERRKNNPRKFDSRPGGKNNNFNNNRGGGGGGSGGGGGNGDSVLKLEAPMKLQRIVEEAPTQQQGGRNSYNNDQDDRSGGGRRQVASVGSSSGGKASVAPGTVDGESDDDEDDSGSSSSSGGGGYERKGGEPGREQKFAYKKKQPDRRRKDKDDNDGRNNRRASLRVGTGKKGRAASLSNRRGSLKKRDRTAEKEARAEAAIERKRVNLPDGPISVAQLADLIDEKPIAVIKYLMTDLGVMASMTQNLDPATCVAVAEGFGRIVGGADEDDEESDDDIIDDDSALATGFVEIEDDPADLKPRAPVVTIMGHVDHGKTSLLDAIRNTRVTKGEAGGITQHIAAYQVDHNGNQITFIDTPGHAAFTDMRERGANITDIVILVVAADDGVKQQTADSIACARQAGVPLVVAINKIDLETADPNRVMSDLTTYDVLTEELGGDIMAAQISAKEGTNLDDLLDKIMIQAEVQELKANPNRNAEAIVVEAFVEKGLGTVATSLVKKGTLRVGDIFVAGETYGRVRAMISTNDGKTRLDEVGPSTPVRIVGFEGVPSAGDPLVVVDDEQTARALAESRQRIAREQSSSSYQSGLMDSVAMAFGSTKERREMCVVVKADVQGSAEALTRALQELKLENDEAIVTIKVLVSEAGEVSKSDIAIASVTPDTTVIAFNVPASFAAMEDARAQNIPIEYYNIVYDAIESVESRMQEVLSPTPDGEYTGSATVQEVFNIGGTGNIAGSRCTDGVLRKGGNVRVMRGDKILVETTIKSLRNFKSETDSIEAGNECGIGLRDFEDFQPDDVIECYVE